MEFTDKELEELLTINEQAKVLIPKLTYNEKLAKEIIDSMKNKKELNKESIKNAYNNYLALAFLELNYSNTEIFRKIETYLD